MSTLPMPTLIARRYLVLLLAATLLAALAIWQWVAQMPQTASPLAPARGISAIDWDDDHLTLHGRAEPKAAAQLALGGNIYPATTDDDGDFTLNITATQAPLTRAELIIGDDAYALLFVRVQGRWAALQRGTRGNAANDLAGRAWLPVAGVHDRTPLSAGVLSLAKDDDGYTAVLSLPVAHTTYAYSNSRLVAVIKHDSAGVALVPLPESTAQLRLDVYNGRTLAQRLRLTVPPGDNVVRWTLNEGTLWLPTDLAAQKAEVDEMLPGQFVPVDDGQPSAAAAATPQHTDAPAVQTEPAR